MDQQPEQSQQPAQPQPPELPVVPVIPSIPEAPAQPVQAQPLPPTPVEVSEEPPLESEPTGRPQPTGETLEWQASEYVEHEKSAKWFIVLALVTLVLVALAIFLMKNYTFALLLVVMAVAIALWAKRPATEMRYRLDTAGVWVNDKFFALHDFRHFGVLQDGGIYAVTLVPNKRFAPGVTVYFPHDLGEQIVDMLGASLPMEEIQPDWIDKLTRRLNF